MADLALIDAKESGKAAEAFRDYLALGPHRSLAKLAASYGKNGTYVGQLERWSHAHHWQERIKARAAEQIERASEFRAGTYVAITEEYYKRVVDDEPMRHVMKIESLNAIFDRVKPEHLSDSGSSGGSIVLQFAFVESSRAD